MAHGTFHRHCLSSPYARAVEAAGGVPIVLPPQEDGIDELLAVIDGLLLSGGPDIEPARFGDETVHPATYGIDLPRDRFEIDLFHGALQRDIPVFGICRGIQVINVALGGTLIQDVPTQHPTSAEVGHRQHERGLESSAIGHQVHATEAALVPIFDGDELGVNSFHHQAIRDLAPGLVPVAYSPDGLIEAVVLDAPGTIFAVQWHPEMMFERHPIHLRPFQHLVSAAATRKQPAIAI
ncbi:MAG: gamma-glutamyl-gamma-aminobutyrate hydrolase family protein [Thermomicrobiales bacterium]|nr:gamma-glutamyl-gamma-aminobutyrate hydrolase family protein [Thermomicrobiales bacterium]